MKAMLSSIRHGIILWDRDGRVVESNPVVVEMLNAEPGLIVSGRTLDEVIDGALARGNLGEGLAGRALADSLRRRDRSRSHQDRRYTRTGRVLEVRSDPTPDGGFVTTYTDVTSIQQAEEALRVAKTAAEAANIAKSRFLAAMSHELRAPLNTTISQSDAIWRSASDKVGQAVRSSRPDRLEPEPIAAAAQEVNSAGRQLLLMVDTILDVARLDAGRFELADELVDLGQLVQACVQQADAGAAAAEVVLTAHLPAAPSVRGDERRLRQVLQHLVANAVKFTPAMGSVCIDVNLHENGNLLLQVSDTGIGIAEHDLDRIFEPFTQVKHGATERFTGPGLGLYISRALMRAHGGELLLRSEPGAGTTAAMLLPAARVVSA